MSEATRAVRQRMPGFVQTFSSKTESGVKILTQGRVTV
ncbi:hypothetical protein GTPT_2924 [Tatumella ptyseos ATCC 33301]|uniref:Uncharacterized protein n=1 Tax=Tatumella ptyseos ATCC 33301 TaxID=1005995 RepID=A0A085JB28_9GAMM|nr:hypothetical protein GTPT_2924 [Tatumella ptyseos ATCC 33301]